MHLEMSKLIIGTMTWGVGRKFTTEEATQLIQRCLDLGLNTFDHADIMADTTEAEFGKAFQSSGIARESIITSQMAFKCPAKYVPWMWSTTTMPKTSFNPQKKVLRI